MLKRLVGCSTQMGDLPYRFLCVETALRDHNMRRMERPRSMEAASDCGQSVSAITITRPATIIPPKNCRYSYRKMLEPCLQDG